LLGENYIRFVLAFYQILSYKAHPEPMRARLVGADPCPRASGAGVNVSALG